MSTISVNITLGSLPMPAPNSGPARAVKQDQQLLLEKIKHYVDVCDSSTPLKPDTTREWEYLKAVYLKLAKSARLSPFQQEVHDLVKPLVDKFTQDDAELSREADGAEMIKKASRAKDIHHEN